MDVKLHLNLQQTQDLGDLAKEFGVTADEVVCAMMANMLALEPEDRERRVAYVIAKYNEICRRAKAEAAA